MFQRNNLLCRRRQAPGFADREGELRLRIFRMDKKRGASIDVSAEHAQALIGGVPRLDDDVVQFVTQEIFHDPLIARLDFQKIRQHAHRG